MKLPNLLRACARALASVVVLTVSMPAQAAVDETNRRVNGLENLFDRLRSHADFLGFRYDRTLAPSAWGEADHTTTHFQGIARSTVAGRPYLFVTRAGMPDDDYARLLIVRMGSRNVTGERMRSNRYEKDDSVEGTQPPGKRHGRRSLRLPLLPSFRRNPTLRRHSRRSPRGRQRQRPRGPGRVPRRLRSRESPPSPRPAGDQRQDRCRGSDPAPGRQVPAGHHRRRRRSPAVLSIHESVVLRIRIRVAAPRHVLGLGRHRRGVGHREDQPPGPPVDGQSRRVRNESLYLVTGRNDKSTTPIISGKDLLYLYKVSGWEEGGTIRIREIRQRHLHTDSDNSDNGELAIQRNQASSFFTDSNANFLAGLCTYVSPTGELLVYAIEHYNWGPRGSVRFVEFRHEQVYREGNPIYDKQPALAAPEFVLEDTVTTLDAGASGRLGSVRPWVEIFEDANYNGRSVIMDWADRDLEDFKDLRKLSWPDGFNDRASSVRWFAPPGWRIRLYDGDNYTVGDNEPYLDLGGLGFQSGIPVLSEKPYEFDNFWYDGVTHETRVTSMKFIPPGEPPDFLDVFPTGEDEPATTAGDDGWSNPKDHLVYRWRLLDPNLDPYPTSSATITPVPGSPWLATLRTFTRESERLFVELTLGPFPEKKLVRPVRFLKRNRTPSIVSTSQTLVGGRVDLTVIVKDDDLSDDLKLYATWDHLPERLEADGKGGQRTFTISHTFTNPDPDQILRSDLVITLRAEDSNGASSPPFLEHARIVWRGNTPPQVTPDSFERAILSGFKTRIQTLVANDSDPDGDAFEFAGVRGVYPDGATVVEQDGWLLYTPAPGAGHLPGGFDYALRDQFKTIGVGRVSIFPEAAAARPSLNLTSLRPRDGGGKVIEFQGLPDRTYVVDAAPLPLGPWSRLTQATADSVGRLRIEDPGAGALRFYKTQLLAP